MKVCDTDDGRRQVVRFLLPRDCIRCDILCTEIATGTAVEAVTACQISLADVSSVEAQMQGHKDWPTALIDEFGDLVAEAECYAVMLGTFSGKERLSWILYHLFQRAKCAGLGNGTRVDLPLSQAKIANAIGLSLVHTNKTFAQLQRAGLIRWSSGVLEVPDPDALARLCHFK